MANPLVCLNITSDTICSAVVESTQEYKLISLIGMVLFWGVIYWYSINHKSKATNVFTQTIFMLGEFMSKLYFLFTPINLLLLRLNIDEETQINFNLLFVMIYFVIGIIVSIIVWIDKLLKNFTGTSFIDEIKMKIKKE